MDKYGRMSINLRVTPELYQQLRYLADLEHRSLGAQALHMIEAALSNIDRSANTPDDIIKMIKPDATTQ